MNSKNRMKKCPKTVTGKHFWLPEEPSTQIGDAIVIKMIGTRISRRAHYRCEYCGLIDDRRKNGN